MIAERFFTGVLLSMDKLKDYRVQSASGRAFAPFI
jgi:hypothetical protein